MSSDWTTLESLILAQAVIKYGEVWTTVSKTVKNHPAVKNDSLADPAIPAQSDFTIKTCAARWSELVEEYEVQQRKTKRDAAVQEVPANVRITQNLYLKRIEELKSSIKADEVTYNRILREIEDIQSGKKDHELTDMMKQIKKTPVLLPDRIEEEPPRAVKEEPLMEVDEKAVEPAKEDTASLKVTPVKQSGKGKEKDPEQEKSNEKDRSKERSTAEKSHEGQGESEEDDDTPLSLTKSKMLQKEENLVKKESPEADKIKARKPVRDDKDPDAEKREETGASTDAEGKMKREELSAKKKLARIRSRGGSMDKEGESAAGEDVESPIPDFALSPSKKDKQKKAWLKNVLNVLQQISGHKHAWAFQNAVRKEDAPNYLDVVKKPTNLSAIRKKLNDGAIQTTIEFHREMMLLFTNAMIFNNHYHEVHGMAVEMCSQFEELIGDLERQEAAENPELALTVQQLRGESDTEDGAQSPSKRKRQESPTKQQSKRRR